MGQGIPAFPTPVHIIDAAKKALDEPEINIYPNFLGILELREALAKKLKVSKEQILITVGAMEAFASSMLSLLDYNNLVGVLSPDYCNHYPAIRLAKAKLLEIPLLEKKDWEIDFAKVEEAAKKGMRVLVLTNPNNPTGSVFEKKEIEKLVKLSNKYGFYFLCDETYSFLSYEKKFCSLLEFFKENDRLIVVRTFSKEYCLTGWRVGYVITSEPLIKIIAKTHDALVGCASKISQKAALVALTGPQDSVLKMKEELRRRRDFICEELTKMGDKVSFSKPQGTYYLFLKYKREENSLFLARKILEEDRLAVVPGIVFGQTGEFHLRLSFGGKEDLLKKGLKILGRMI